MAKQLEARFFQLESGREPVREWLLGLDKPDRQIIGKNIMRVEFGWPIGMPTCRSLSDGLWEVRSNISDGRIARVLFAIFDDEMILLTGFVKKTHATPHDEIRVARERMKEYQR